MKLGLPDEPLFLPLFSDDPMDAVMVQSFDLVAAVIAAALVAALALFF